jgi:hypothetical protein
MIERRAFTWVLRMLTLRVFDRLHALNYISISVKNKRHEMIIDHHVEIVADHDHHVRFACDHSPVDYW